MKRLFPVAAMAFMLAGCGHYYGPKVVPYYDAGCEIKARRMELTEVQQKALVRPGDSCTGEAECADYVVRRLTDFIVQKTIGGPASAIISGTIVMAGNTVFWMEKQGGAC